MYGLPADFDYSIFVGRTCEYVGFLENMIWISFDDHLSIGIESSYSHQTDPDDEGRVVDVPPEQSTLMQLTGKVVESAEAENPYTLMLRFQDGHVLCLDDTKMYESFKIVHHGRETIV